MMLMSVGSPAVGGGEGQYPIKGLRQRAMPRSINLVVNVCLKTMRRRWPEMLLCSTQYRIHPRAVIVSKELSTLSEWSKLQG